MPDHGFSAVFDHLDIGVLFISASNRIAFIDETLARLKGIDPDDAADKPAHDCGGALVHPDVIDSLELMKQNVGARIVRSFQHGGTALRETYVSVSWPGGDYMGIIMLCEAFRGVDAAGGLQGSDLPEGLDSAGVRIAEDYANALQFYLDDIERKYSELSDLAAAKDRFVERVSEELVNPLTAILGYSAMIGDEAARVDSPRLKKAASVIRDKSRWLRRLVNSYRDLAASGAGGLDVKPSPSRLAAVVGRVADSLAAAFDDAGVDLERGIAPELPLLWADEPLLEQALTHLLVNALRFSNRGGTVRIEARFLTGEQLAKRIAQPGEEVFPALDPNRPEFDGFLEIGVRDQGGEPDRSAVERALDLLRKDRFEPLLGRMDVQAGLAMTREIIDAHGGAVAFCSNPGAGNRVALFWPAAAVDSDAGGYDADRARPGKLLILGSRLGLDHGLQAELKRERIEFAVAESTAEASARLNAGGIALLFIDAASTRTSARLAVKAVLKEMDPPVPVILLAADEEQAQAAIDAGADDALTRDAGRASVLDAVRKYVI